jgi:hypothetical protein
VEGSVIVFLQKTWFLWWGFATLIILRWFHLVSLRPDERDLEAADSCEEESATASNQIPSGTASRLFT